MAELLLSPFQSERRRPCRAVHLHLYAKAERSWGNKQLDGAQGHATKTEGNVGGLDEGEDDVCHSLSYGAARFTSCEGGD